MLWVPNLLLAILFFVHAPAPMVDEREPDRLHTEPPAELDEIRHLPEIPGLDDVEKVEGFELAAAVLIGKEFQVAHEAVEVAATADVGIGFGRRGIDRNLHGLDPAIEPAIVPRLRIQQDSIGVQSDLELRKHLAAHPHDLAVVVASERVAVAAQNEQIGVFQERQDKFVANAAQLLLLLLLRNDQFRPARWALQVTGNVVTELYDARAMNRDGLALLDDLDHLGTEPIILHGLISRQGIADDGRALVVKALIVGAVEDPLADHHGGITIPDFLWRILEDVTNRFVACPDGTADVNTAATENLGIGPRIFAEAAFQAVISAKKRWQKLTKH
jgi:hypothetical protein